MCGAKHFGLKAGKEVAPRGVEEDNPQLWLLEKGPSPIRLDILASLLDRYSDREAAVYLFNGFSKGFRIPAPSAFTPLWAKNLRSAEGMEDEVEKKIKRS